MRALTAALLSAVAAAACGDLSNVPLHRGLVKGQVVGADERPFVSAFGEEEQDVEVQEDGAFEARMLAGARELYFATRTDAKRIAVQLIAGDVLELGPVTLDPGLFVTFVFADSGGRLQEIAGTQVEDLQTDGGEVTAGPLARGCYSAIVRPADEADLVIDFCVATGGERIKVATP